MSIYTLSGKDRKDVHLWTPIEEVESSALDQLKNVAALPWVFHHVAAMPDVHYGKGATVGSVIAMKDALAPAAVGVDIGCVDADTEYLSPTGWKRIADYDGGRVMQYEPESEHGTFVFPEFVKRESKGFLHFHTKYGVDQMLSPDHRVLIWKTTGRARERIQTVMSAQNVANEQRRLVQGFKAEFKTTFIPQLSYSVNLTDEELRVQVALMADGCLDFRGESKAAAIRLKKERKKNRLRNLLVAANIQYTDHDAPSEPDVTTFRFKAPWFTKTYYDFWNASLHQLKIISEECLKWDGNEEDGAFFTRDKNSADFIQYAFSASGFRGVMRSDVHKDGAVDYRVFANTNTMVGLGGDPKSEVVEVPSRDGLEYCFKVPSGFWVMRRGGNVVMTGNCGMGAIKTNLKASDLPDNLEKLRSAIEAAIPVGFNSHPTGPQPPGIPMAHELFGRFGQLDQGVQNLLSKATHQLGTLGGGNHFIEICLDDSGTGDLCESCGDRRAAAGCGVRMAQGGFCGSEPSVWLMLHSGSRNIGKELAEIHISKAMELTHNQKLPDKDLAVFLSGTPETAAYRNDLMWAQDYAKFNRRVMFELLKEVVLDQIPQVEFEEPILCHHNYVSEETHFGEQVLVTRKGAISARTGELGIIPGSMGTKSYIVRGLGNPESFHSASHGAGRRMSRGAAKRNFTLEDFAKQTEGVCCRKDAGVLDEIPQAYKDIDQVMANQADLVEIVATLKQVLCVKG